MLEEQPFGVRSVISGHILRRTLAVLIGITAAKVGIVGTVDAGADHFLGVLDAFSNLCGNLGQRFFIKFALVFAIQCHGLFEATVLVHTMH